MAIETCFAKKVGWFQDSYDRFLAPLRNDRELDLAALDVKNRIGRLSLLKDNAVLLIMRNGSTAIEGGEKHLRVEFGFSLPGHGKP